MDCSPWDSPDQNTRVGSPTLLQGDLPNPGIEPRSPALQADSLPAEPLRGLLFAAGSHVLSTALG